MVSEPTCRHDSITVYHDIDGGPGRMWACAGCGVRLYPACRICIDVGHRGEEHVEPALDVERQPAAHVWVGGHGVATGGSVLPPAAPALDEDRLARALREALSREHDARFPRHTVTLDPRCATCRLLNEDAAVAGARREDEG